MLLPEEVAGVVVVVADEVVVWLVSPEAASDELGLWLAELVASVDEPLPVDDVGAVFESDVPVVLLDDVVVVVDKLPGGAEAAAADAPPALAAEPLPAPAGPPTAFPVEPEPEYEPTVPELPLGEVHGVTPRLVLLRAPLGDPAL